MYKYILILGIAYGTFAQAAQGHTSHGRGHQGNPHSHSTSGGASNSNSNAGAIARTSNSLSAGDATSGSVRGGDTVVNTDYPASSAAAIVPAACQSGASFQSEDVGVSVVASDPLCDYYKAAQASYTAYLKEAAICTAVCAVECTPNGYVYAEKTTCELAQDYLDDYHLNLEMAQELVESAEFSAKVDRNVSGWSKFMLFVLVGIALL